LNTASFLLFRRRNGKVTNFTTIKNTNIMLEGKRQKQVAGLLNKELSDIFQRLGMNMMDGGMVSISSVKITPDLYEARIYLSFFKIEDSFAALKKIEERSWEIKKELTARVRHQLRSMPTLTFYIDDTLDYVDKMEQLFKDIKKEENEKRKE
jgi:ribosome-binding factor A